MLCLFHSALVFEGAFFCVVPQRFVPPESYVSRMEENFAGQVVISCRTKVPTSVVIPSYRFRSLISVVAADLSYFSVLHDYLCPLMDLTKLSKLLPPRYNNISSNNANGYGFYACTSLNCT